MWWIVLIAFIAGGIAAILGEHKIPYFKRRLRERALTMARRLEVK
jgi:hypothetical protein